MVHGPAVYVATPTFTYYPPAPAQRARGKAVAVRQAFGELWPDGLPNGMGVKERDRRIIEWFKSRELLAPSTQTIYRALLGPKNV